MKNPRKGTRVQVRWVNSAGQSYFCSRWWNQLDAFVARRPGCDSFQWRQRSGDEWEDYLYPGDQKA